MKTMVTIILIILLVLGVLFMGQTTITINPFSFHMDALPNVIGMFLLGAALCCFDYQTTKETKAEVSNTEYIRGYKDGLKSPTQVKDKDKELTKDGCKGN